MDQNEFLWRRKYVCGFPGVKRTVHAPLAETFRKFEEWLERSGRHTKRADTTGLVCPAEVIVFLAARERTYSASKYTPRGWLTYSVLTGWRINIMVRSVTDFSTFRFLDTVCWNILSLVQLSICG